MSRKIVQKERKSQIIEGLYKCLQKKPFNETSIKDIAKEAGVNHGVLHYYFKNKEDILLNFIDDVLDQHRNDFYVFYQSVKEKKLDKREKLKKMFQFMNNITFNNELAKVFIEIYELGIYNEKVKKKINKLYEEWNEILVTTIKPYIKDDQEAERLSLTIMAFHEGISLFTHLNNKDNKRYRELVDSFNERMINEIS